MNAAYNINLEINYIYTYRLTIHIYRIVCTHNFSQGTKTNSSSKQESKNSMEVNQLEKDAK